MIRNVKVSSGYASELPALADREISFGPGLSILWGHNGSGKSSLLGIIAAYCGIEGGGWTTYQPPIFKMDPAFPQNYRHISPGRCEADLLWDGTPTFFYNQPASRRSSDFFWDDGESPDGITSVRDQFVEVFASPSSGQKGCAKLMAICDTVERVPNVVGAEHPKNWNSIWVDNWAVQRDYFESLPRDGGVTVLMDKPNVSLSVPNEIAFWTVVAPKLAERCQLIIATHSTVIPMLRGLRFDVVEFSPGYWEECCRSLSDLSSGEAESAVSSSPDPAVFGSAAKRLRAKQKREAKQASKPRKHHGRLSSGSR